MNNQNKKILLILNLLCFLLLVYGCSTLGGHPTETNISATSINKPNVTKSATPIPTSTSEFKVILPVNPTIYPTIQNEQESYLLSLLQDKNCQLPCYMNITPGLTIWDEAKSILKNSGAYLGSPDHIENSTHHYCFILDIGDKSILPVTPGSTWIAEDYKIRYSIELQVENNTVQLMWIRVSTKVLLAKFQNYWSNYSLREIFLRQGLPKEIVGWTSSGGGYELALIYDEQERIIFLNGTFQEKTICPNSEKKLSGLTIAIKDSDYQSKSNPWGVPLTDREIWKPIEEIMGISSLDFYKQVIENSLTCFEVLISN